MREVRPRLGFDPCIPVGVFAALLVIGCLTACITAPTVQTLAAGGTGRIAFQSVTVTTQEFLRGVGGGIPVVITGDRQLPQGPTAPVPAIVLVHGSAGLTPTVRRWKDVLLKLGVATFVLDSFSGRGIRETFTDQSRLSHFAMLVDAYRALALLAMHPQIDLTRIGLMGFSKGGQVTLPADFTTRACARGGRGMSHQQGVGPGRLREGSALTPCPSWPRNMQGSSAGLERTLSSLPHRLSDALSSDRRVLSRIWGWYKFHRQGVRDLVRGSSNQALKLQRVARGCISVSVPLAQGLRKSSDFLMCTQGKS